MTHGSGKHVLVNTFYFNLKKIKLTKKYKIFSAFYVTLNVQIKKLDESI